MKVLVVSGFLGAGKTTFIKEMTKKVPRDFVVMENEYGEVGIDKNFLDEDKNLNIWELTEGCICCSMKSDFASSILTIANTINPEYLIVEPTGLGLLSNIIHNIQQIEYERITLLNPVTILDANCFDHSMKEYKEIFKDQLQTAGTIIVSKGIFSSVGETRKLTEKIRQINPDAFLQVEPYTKVELSWWERLLSMGLNGNPLPVASISPPDLENLGLNDIFLPDSNDLVYFLEQIIHKEFGDICRAKGIVNVGNCLLRFDVVDDRYSICGFSESAVSKAIFIGKNIQRNQIRKRLLPTFREIPLKKA